jgi:Arc/MetJ family transcription regulator
LWSERIAMKTLVDIDEGLLAEAMKLSAAPTKKETIRRALEELVRARRREDLKRMAGSGAVELTHAGLRRIRRRAR